MVWVLLLVLGAKIVERQVWWDWVICRVSLLQGPKNLWWVFYTFVYVGGALGISWGWGGVSSVGPTNSGYRLVVVGDNF